MARTIGDAWVTVSPDTVRFRAQAEAKLKTALAGIKPVIPVALDINKNALGQLMDAAQRAIVIKANFDAHQAYESLVALKAQMEALSNKLILLRADNRPAEGAVADLQLRLATLAERVGKIKITADPTPILRAQVEFGKLEVAANRVAPAVRKAAASVADLNPRAVTDLQTRIAELAVKLADLKLNVTDAKAEAAVSRLQARLEVLRRTAADFTIGSSQESVLKARDSLTGLEGTVATLASRMQDARDKTSAANAALVLAGNGALQLGIGWGALGNKIKTFGGAFGKLPFIGTVSVLHLLADAFIELAVVVVPATVALLAFGAAAAPTFSDIVRKMQAVSTTSTALQTKIYPLTNSFSALEDAVRPSVIQLFGDALYVLDKNMGKTQSLAVATGKVLDQLGLRIAAALTSGSLQKLIAEGPADLARIGDIVGNIAGIIGNVLKSLVVNYGQILLVVLDNVTKALEAVTASHFVQWLLGAGIAFHGFIVWAGLAVTGAVVLGNALLGLLAKFNLAKDGAVAFDAVQFGSGIIASLKGIGLLIVELATLGTTADIAAASMTTLKGVGTALGAIDPLVWVTLAVGALVYFGLQLTKSTAQVNQFAQDTQNALGNIPVDKLGVTLTRQYSVSLSTLATAQRQVAANSRGLADAFKAVFDSTGKYTQAQAKAVSTGISLLGTEADQRALLPILHRDMTNYSAVLKAAGGNASLLNDAGITSNDILNASASQLAQLKIEAAAAADAQNALALGTGRAAAAQNAQTNEFLVETLPAMQKVTDAEDQLLSVILGSQTAFNSFQQSIIGTSAKFQAPSGLADAARLAKGDLSGLNDQSLAFANTLYSISIPALQKMSDQLALQGASTGDLTKALATGAGEILQYTGNNKEARTVVADLINNALGPATVNLQNLNKWVSQNSTSMQGLSGIIAQSTINASQFAGVLQGQLNVMLAAAALNALGGQKALNQFAIAVQGGNTDAASLAANGGAMVLKMFQRMYGKDAPAAKKAFIDWAKNGLDLSDQAAQNLWNTLVTNLNPALSEAGNVALVASGKIDSTFIKSLAQIGFSSPGITRDVLNFSGAILSTGDTSSKTKSARDILIADLVRAGVQADVARKLVNGLQGQIDALHGKSVTVTVGADGVGGLKITGPGASGKRWDLTHLAGGGRVGGYGSSDTVPAMLTPGEVVVPKAMVAAGVVDHLRGRLPGFAGGGLVQGPPWAADNLAGLAGPALGDDVAAALRSLYSAAAAAITAARIGGWSGGVAQWVPDVQRVMAMLGIPGGDLGIIMRQMVTESGGNPNAINLVDVNAQQGDPSRGLMQVIGATFATYRNPALSPNIYDPLANIYAGLNYALHRYGSNWVNVLGQGHGYGRGGLVYDSGGVLPAGGWGLNTSGHAEMVTPATGPGSLHETNVRLDRLSAQIDRLIHVTSGQGQAFAQGLAGSSARGASRGYYGR